MGCDKYEKRTAPKEAESAVTPKRKKSTKKVVMEPNDGATAEVKNPVVSNEPSVNYSRKFKGWGL
jgi:hypothetical protein